jgi:hypothetical protein
VKQESGKHCGEQLAHEPHEFFFRFDSQSEPTWHKCEGLLSDRPLEIMTVEPVTRVEAVRVLLGVEEAQLLQQILREARDRATDAVMAGQLDRWQLRIGSAYE